METPSRAPGGGVCSDSVTYPVSRPAVLVLVSPRPRRVSLLLVSNAPDLTHCAVASKATMTKSTYGLVWCPLTSRHRSISLDTPEATAGAAKDASSRLGRLLLSVVFLCPWLAA